MRAPEFWNHQGIVPSILSPLGTLYGFSVQVKQARAHPYRANARVLCIGNLTAGGTGKTPVAIAAAKKLAARGLRIVFLTRGYGGHARGPVLVDPARHSAAEVGDEPLLLAAHGATIVARDRAKGAQLADALEANVIVMDDGFQNFSIRKDVSLIVVDAASGFGNGRMIPAGPLREPVERGLARADAVLLAGDGFPPFLPFHGPVLRTHLEPTTPDMLKGRVAIAFAGIGRAEKFFDMLRGMGMELLGTRSFPDHHPFTTSELSELKRSAQAAGAILVTTQKDFVRIDQEARRDIVPVPVHAVFSDDAAFGCLLDRLAIAGNVGSS